MRIASSPTLRIAAGLSLAALLSIVGYKVFRRLISHGPEALLERADEMSWLNSWINAEPLYHQAELQFIERHQSSKALYARVSQIPAHSESSISIPNQIALLRSDLDLPEGTPIEPDHLIDFDWRESRTGRDLQLEHAVQLAKTEFGS